MTAVAASLWSYHPTVWCLLRQASMCAFVLRFKVILSVWNLKSQGTLSYKRAFLIGGNGNESARQTPRWLFIEPKRASDYIAQSPRSKSESISNGSQRKIVSHSCYMNHNYDSIHLSQITASDSSYLPAAGQLIFSQLLSKSKIWHQHNHSGLFCISPEQHMFFWNLKKIWYNQLAVKKNVFLHGFWWLLVAKLSTTVVYKSDTNMVK